MKGLHLSFAGRLSGLATPLKTEDRYNRITIIIECQEISR